MNRNVFIILITGLIFVICSSKVFAVQILTTEEPPTNYTENGKVVGTTVDIIREIKKTLNESTKIKSLPWARAYKIAKSQKDIIAFTAGKTDERVKLGFHFIGPVFTRKYVLVKKTGSNINVKSLEDVKAQGITVGGVRGDWRSKLLKSKGIKVDEVSSHESNIKKLAKGKVDLWVASDIEMVAIAKKAGIDKSAVEVAHAFREGQSYIMISKESSPALIKKWRDAFEKLQNSGFFNKSSQKWAKKLGMNLKYSAEKGFYVE